jgi:hypothetical protein
MTKDTDDSHWPQSHDDYCERVAVDIGVGETQNPCSCEVRWYQTTLRVVAGQRDWAMKQLAARSKRRASTYWLIERGSPAEWLAEYADGIEGDAPEKWTRKAHEAIRFEWLADARYAISLRVVDKPSVRATEHMDCDGPTPLSASAPKWASFSDFIRNATDAEKEEVYTEVMKKASERQEAARSSMAQPITDERFAEVIKFLKYWHSHHEFWPLVNEQLRIIAKKAAAQSATAIKDVPHGTCPECGAPMDRTGA